MKDRVNIRISRRALKRFKELALDNNLTLVAYLDLVAGFKRS